MRLVYQIMNRWMGTPFVWGESDCCLGLADWHRLVKGGDDPAAALRGAYFDAVSCQQLCGWFTRPVEVIEDCLARVGGLPRVEALAVGDVAVIVIPRKDRPLPAGAIWLGDCWGCKGPEGATTLSPNLVRPLACWGMGYAE
ncbi:hypothetical protein [Sagittula sp. MA-2]|jgi:hypothetical protein|uniref:DUF6950 family protein n=1 Tax=Sagittula sp. MA-2 TaxID=3048007 RepID=UPI0024C28734|nr:hypothetical protein [Sagittula sp. MA-2]WHZ33404.1 hypothetical protein QNI11_12140 [Sagittula sp. MA-2]